MMGVLVRFDMLTDELFGVESKSLTDQLFADKPKSLTDQLVSEETPSKPDVSGIAKGLKAEDVRENFPDKTIQQRYMKELLAPSVEEFDKLKTNPIITEDFKQGVMSTLKGYGQLASQPMEILRGGAEFVLALPGFALGIIGAGQKMLERMGRPFTFNDLYDAASEGMHDLQEFWGEKMVEPLLGPPSEASSIVGQTAMAPALGLSIAGHHVARFFEGYPNIQGLTKFAGDIGGLVALGRIYHGSRGEVTARAENIARRADDIAKIEEKVNQIADEPVRIAQQKILDMRKKQLEMEAKALQDNLDYGQMIKEDLTAKGRQVAEIKQPRKYIADEAINRVMEKIPEKPGVEVISREKAEAKLGPELVKDIEAELSKPIEQVTKAELKNLTEKWEKEEITEVLLQAGTRQSEQLGTHRSPFREKDPQVTAEQRRLLAEKKISDSPDMIIAKWTNDINSWLDGVEGVDIAKARNSLSDFAVAVKDPANRIQLLDYFDGDSAAVRNFVEMTGEAASWARRSDRPKDVTLGMGVDPTKIVGLFKKGKVLDLKDKLKIKKIKEDIEKYGTPEKAITFANRDEAVDVIKLSEKMEAHKDHLKAIEKAELHKLDFPDKSISEVSDLIRSNPSAYKATVLVNRYGVGIDRKDGQIVYRVRGPELDKKGVVALESQLAKYGIEKPGPRGITLGMGVDPSKAYVEGAKQIVKMAKEARDYVIQARGIKAFRPRLAAQLLKEELKRDFVDRSGNIRVKLLDKLGEDGYSVVQKMYLSKGASTISANMLKQMRKEVYNGLTGNEKRILDSLILADRIIDIGSYKTPKQFKFPEAIKPEKSIAYKELFQQIEKLTPDRAAELRRRSEAYFEWMKRPLQSLLDAGLISKEEFNNLVSHNYRRIKLVDIYDKRYQTKIGKQTRTVYDSGVESLARGRTTDIFEPSSEIMALEVFNRAYGRVMNNEANKTLLDIARKHPENPFVRISEKEGGKEKIPSGWNRIFAYEEGVRKSAYLSPEMSKEWITSNPEISYRLSQFLRYTSASPVLRTFATGINWGFALANLPRDVMHTWFAARVFEDGQWKPVYSPHAPAFAMQMGRDLATTFTDAALRKGRYESYIKEGGGMEFLVHQGRILQRGRRLEGPLDKVMDFLGYFGETSEIMTRLAIRERVMRQGKSSEEGTFAARDYMDFGQGGGIAKAADNAIPYLNASIQGTRGLFRAFVDNPVTSTYKLAQFAAVVSGIYVAMGKLTPETKKNLEGNRDMINNLVIPLGDQFGFVDEQGQTRYPYIKIPLDPGQKFFKKFFEASTDKWLGNEVDVAGTVDALRELSPVPEVSGILPPTISGVLGYVANKDFWLNEDIWKQTKPFSYPRSKEEYTGRTPEFFIDVGEKTDLSPERTKFAVEELVTSGTLWSHLLGQGYDAAFGDMPKEKKEQHLAMVLAKTPVFKRFIGVTNPYSKHAEEINKAQEEVVLKRFVENRDFDIKVDGYLYGEKGQVSREEVIKDAQQYKDKDTYDRLIDRFKFEEAIKDLPEKSFWRRMKGLRLEAKAKVFVDRLRDSTPEEKEQLWREYGIVSRAKGVISPEFRSEVLRKMSEKDD